MVNSNINLPYFDLLLKEFNKGNIKVENPSTLHVHWGYWQNPQLAEKTFKDFQVAKENLTQLVCDFANIKDGMKILDVGCGFGGTIASLNERFSNLQLVGVNIDDRQLEIAKNSVSPKNNNQIEFVCADACQLPFEDNYFDVVLAVECIFHFPSRHLFFQQANRVLKTQGKLSLSDFVLSGKNAAFMPIIGNIATPIIASFYGKSNCCTMKDYQELEMNNQFNLIKEKDITEETLPTYDVLIGLFDQIKFRYFNAYIATQLLKIAQASKTIIYQVLTYEKKPS